MSRDYEIRADGLVAVYATGDAASLRAQGRRKCPFRHEGRLDAKFGDHAFVEFNAEAGALGYGHTAVYQRRQIADQFSHQRRRAEAVFHKIALSA